MVIKKITKRIAKNYVSDFVNYLKTQKNLPVSQAYIFGSYVAGRQKDWSDIDVAIISDKFKGAIDPYEYLWRNLRDIDVKRRIEPIGFHPKNFIRSNPIAAEIQKNGMLV